MTHGSIGEFRGATARKLVLALACAAGLASCTSSDPDANGRSSVTGSGITVDLSARRPNERRDGSGAASADRTVGGSRQLSQGDLLTTAAAGRSGESGNAEAGAYRLNFERAEIKDVVHAVLNDTLGLNYTMSTDVSGQITVSSARPLNRNELLSTLENVLAGQGFAMTNGGGTYRIAPSTTGAGRVEGEGSTPGYGVSVVPLRHVSVAMMSRLVSGFVADTDGVRVDPSRNAMVVRGPGAKREEAVRAIMAFDADWMQGQSVSLFEVRRARPEAVVAELSQIFDAAENGAGSGVIQFKPITRLRAVLAVSKNPELIKRAETFIRRLDGESEGAAENVFVYKARYREAKDLARIVSSLFAAGGDAGGQGQSQGQSPSFGGAGGAGSSTSPPASGAGDQSSGYTAAGGGGSGLGSSTIGTMSGSTFASALGEKGTAGGGALGSAPDVIDLTRQGSNAAAKISVSADAANNSVITYADGETYRKIHAALLRLDSSPLQVAVNVMIAEVQLNEQLRHGIQYFVGSDRLGAGTDKGSIGLFNQTANVIQKQIPGFNFLAGAAATPDVIITALDDITDIEVLSSPSLVVLENQTATLQVGDSVPITTRQAQSIETPSAPLINQVEFRDTGIILKVTPRIGQNDAVTMQIEQEISSVSSAADTLTPTISKRKVASAISVVSGQTVLLAGLISEKRQKNRGGIPLLNQLPAVGELFSSTNNGSGRTELVVFIRPVVVRNGEDAQTVAEEFRSRLRTVGVRSGPVVKR